ncbi:PIN domain-containing protein [Streptomyces sp. NPDC056210]|uniref:PIN domain-containing protein n=1 Tax=Streptomyces sp. NPDC056210 TaxID=3345746 RepID=UPI0035DCA660
MIILDTNTLWGLSPEDGSADLLRAIRAAVGEKVAVPWVVMEELAAQQAIKYQDQHERAAAAVEALREVTPGGLDVRLDPCDSDAVRKHWRARWGTVVDVIPTSHQAFKTAAFREANLLPPCKLHKSQKIGSRDAAIWLSAVEYARQHPRETVYFVSNNTKDFGDGSAYPAPMDKDVADLADRFKHLRTMTEVVAEFAMETETDDALVRSLLEEPKVLSRLVNTATASGCLPMDGSFECTAEGTDGESLIIPAFGWVTGGHASVAEAELLRSYRIGEQEWCTAVVQWQLTGLAHTDRGTVWGSCRLPTSVLLAPSATNPRLTILRAGLPQPLRADAFRALQLPRVQLTQAEETAMQTIRESVATSMPPDLHPLRGPRSYEGAWARIRRAGDSIGVPRTSLDD